MAIRTALVVDDSRLARLTLTKLLEKRDIQVTQASSAREAMESLRGRRPDVIMMDVTMPETDGFEATRQITGNPDTSAIPIVMCTAEDTSEARDRAHDCGAHGFLTKPASEENIADVLHRLADQLEAAEPIVVEDSLVPATTLDVTPKADFDSAEIDARARCAAEAVLREQGGEVFSELMTDVARKVFESMAPANDSRNTSPLSDDFAEEIRKQAVESATAAAGDAARQVARDEADAAARSVAETCAAEAAENATSSVAERVSAELRAELDSRIEALLESGEFAGRIDKSVGAALQEARVSDTRIAEVAQREASELVSRKTSEIVAKFQDDVDTSDLEALRAESQKALAMAKKVLVVSVVVLAAAAGMALVV